MVSGYRTHSVTDILIPTQLRSDNGSFQMSIHFTFFNNIFSLDQWRVGCWDSGCHLTTGSVQASHDFNQRSRRDIFDFTLYDAVSDIPLRRRGKLFIFNIYYYLSFYFYYFYSSLSLYGLPLSIPISLSL